jgi:NAD(P)-dependent dehydrogenase (short-subunit alcohol dehydrogenase family)
MASSTPTPVVLLTGASSGIGRATALHYARAGHVRLVLVGRRETALAETSELVRALDPTGTVEAHAWVHDLGDTDAVRALAERMRTTFGRLDVLINNAGIGSDSAFEDDAASTDIDALLDVNLRAPIALTQQLGELLAATRGAVVNVSSVAGLLGTPDAPVYSATKWALTGFSEALHARWAPLGVHVACIHPGPVPTPGWPHTELLDSPLRRFVATDVDAVARTIVRAGQRRGGSAPIRPRTYHAIPVLRGVAPWLVRHVLAPAARSSTRRRLAGRNELAR